MFWLRLASITAATTTIILNAHAGFISAKALEYAVLFAVLYAALDIAKCSLLVAARNARLSGAYGLAIICWLFFPCLFVNSVWNAVGQVAITRDEGKADKVGAAQTRTRTDADYQRLARDLTIMQTNPTFSGTAACTLPKTKEARAFCDAVRTAQSALATTSAQLAETPPTDAQPHVTWISAMLGITVQPIQFTAALLPVLLAEVLGSIGFYISARINFKAPAKPVQRPWFRRHPKPVPPDKRPPEASPGPSADTASPQPKAAAKPPPFKLPMPRAQIPAPPPT